jgi:DNA-binding winged helix-turn-helix (wHTH) protein
MNETGRQDDPRKLREPAMDGEEQKLRRDLDRCRFLLHNISDRRACRLILQDMLEETEARLSLLNRESSARAHNLRWHWIVCDGHSWAEPRVRVQFASWRFDPASRELVSSAGEAVALTNAEFELLVAFVSNPRRVMSRDRLLDLSRHREAAPFDRTIDVQVGRLRRKLRDDPKNPALIKTVRGGGYIFTSPVESAASPTPSQEIDPGAIVCAISHILDLDQ